MSLEDDFRHINERFVQEEYAWVIRELEGNSSDEQCDGRRSFVLAESYRQVGRLNDAMSVLVGAIPSITDKSVLFDCLVCHAEIRKAKGDFAAADESYLKALQVADDKAPGWLRVLRGSNFLEWEQFDRAEQAFREARSMDNVDDDEVLLNLAVCARAKGDYESCAAFAKELLATSSSYRDSANQILATLRGCV